MRSSSAMRAGARRRFRVAIAGFLLESVTFIDELMTLAQFRAQETSGEALIDRHRGANTPTGGFIDVCEREDVEMVPMVHATGGAAGPADDAYEHYLDRIVDGLAAAGATDGLLLDLHGAMTTPTRLDADAETLDRVRKVVGHDVRIVVALDYANLDERTIAPADAVFGYHYSPHTDMAATGMRGDLPVANVEGRDQSCLGDRQARCNGSQHFQCDRSGPPQDDRRSFGRRSRDFVRISRCVGLRRFSYADVRNCGFAVVAVTDGNRKRASEIAKRCAEDVRREREALNHRELVCSVDEGIERARAIVAQGGRPVVLLEHAARMNDSTYLLRAVLELRLGRTAVPLVWDPRAAAAAIAAGLGARVSITVGGHSSARAGGPVTVAGTVVYAGETQYRATGRYFTGRLVNLGPTAVTDTGDVVVSVTSEASTAGDDELPDTVRHVDRRIRLYRPALEDTFPRVLRTGRGGNIDRRHA